MGKKILVGAAIAAVIAAIAFSVRSDLGSAVDAVPGAENGKPMDNPADSIGEHARPDGARGGGTDAADAADSDANERGDASARDGTVDHATSPGSRPDTPRGALPTAVLATGTGSDGDARAGEPASTARSTDAQATADDPRAILRRAAEAYIDVHALRADFTQRLHNPVLGEDLVSRGTLYQRDPDRFLMRFSEPEGDIIVSDGRHFWIYYPSANPRQVVRTPVSPAGAGSLDLRSHFLGDPTQRFEARLEGREAVHGRNAYVLLLTPRDRTDFRRLKVWVDDADHLVRRFEIEEHSGAVRHFDLRDLEINPRLGDDLFRFTPPEGVRIVDRG